jgi:hypothetical protein
MRAARVCVGGRYAQSATMAEVRPARNGGLCKSMDEDSRVALAGVRYLGSTEPGAIANSPYREHSMATNSSVLAMPTGMAPVISSRSTLRKEAACVYSRERQ